MKNLFRTAICLLVATASAFSQSGWDANGSATVNAVGPTGALTSKAVNHTLQVSVVSPAACTIRLEGSNDGVTWADLSGAQACTSSTMFHVDGKFVKYIRAYLITYSGDAVGAVVSLTYAGGS